jgi:hypothetical protein
MPRGKNPNSLKNLRPAADLTGRRFGRLVAESKTGEKNKDGSLTWLCRCDCGNVARISAHDLLRGNTTSCGCRWKDTARNATKYLGRAEGTTAALIASARKPKNNASGYRGVSFHKKSGRWRAYITFKGRQYHLGLYDTPEQAAGAREEAENKLYGPFLAWYHQNFKKK